MINRIQYPYPQNRLKKLRDSGVQRTTRSFSIGSAGNSLDKVSFLLVRFLWTSKENEHDKI
ncbi:hypothetical protein ABN763_17445 [Spongiivirga sp. MCCC 1A20706]|uniref:hypothetical protein n=1 Tax=Spongiivirga sp. MCCC 1A20706 TaxID=3160963 RepID=UPI003977A308